LATTFFPRLNQASGLGALLFMSYFWALITALVACVGVQADSASSLGALRLRGGGNVFSDLQERVSNFLPRRAGPKIIISGAPASGKGTQCEFIVDKFGVVQHKLS